MNEILFWLCVAAVVSVFYGPMIGDAMGENLQSHAIVFLVALFLWPLVLLWVLWKYITR
jgi:uncharacterized membrane protein